MLLAVSPYHLTTRDPAALAAMLLADRAVTMLPVPPAGIDRESVTIALRTSPPYMRLLESWRWAIPLFRDGVISSLAEDQDALDDARATRSRVESEPSWQALRPFMHPGPFGAEHYLDDVSTDLLKGGPDPGWSLPIVAGLDALAARHGMFVVRAGGGGSRAGAAKPGARTGIWRGSAAQLAEARLGEQIFAIAIPVLTQAAGETILRARAAMSVELAALREAMVRATQSLTRAATDRVRAAAKDYTAAFERFIASRGGRGRDDDDGRQALDGFMRVSAVRLPADAALLSARVATAVIRAARPAGANVPPPPAGLRPLIALVIEPMTIQPRRTTK